MIKVDFIVLDGEQRFFILWPHRDFAVDRFCSRSFRAELQVIEAFRKMIEIPGMHIWASQIISNGIEHHFVPVA